MPELDGIRGLAILGVLCTHGAKLTGLFSSTSDSFPEKLFMYTMVPLWGGVDLFFVLSGFLITGILLRTKANANYFSSFYARRVLRIFPIYYLVLVLCVIAGHYSATIESFLPPSASWKFSYFIYLQNWPIFWHGEKMMAGIWGAYWSLAVEEQFYFVWPLVVFLFSTKTVTRIALIGVACALPLRILLCHVYFKGEIGLAQMTSSRIDGLFLGAACAVYMFEYKRPVPMRWIVAAASVGAAIMGFITVFHHNELVATWTWMTTIGISGFALLSVALVAISQYHFPLLQRALTFRWLRLLGKYSYGIYVYHLMIFLWLGNLLAHPATAYLRATLAGRILLMLIGMAAAFLVAKISYDLYESRFLRLKKYFNPA
jgi:peptidoglycan/LPS O-acetylase OafA/YrhL